VRRPACFLLVVIACLSWPGQARAAAEPDLTATAAVLMEAGTGQLLYDRRAGAELPPASTTKVLTAILALELGRLDAPVKVSRYAAATPGASIYLQTGEVLPLIDLVKGALINSGNDAAVAIAESLAGTEADFAWLMNRKARQLGAYHTHFVNPNGLPAPGHYTTARDLALMARYGLGNSLFRRLVATVSDQIPAPDGWRYLYNTNRLLGTYPGADGVKTGTTDAAGQCLVASATRQGRQLIAVVLGSCDRYADTRALLDYGFNSLYAEAAAAGEPVAQVYVKNGVTTSVAVTPAMTVGYTVTMAKAALLEKRILLPAYVKAPVHRGDELGRVQILFQGQEVASTALVAARDVAARPIFKR